jgi:hypothetical protein
MIEACSCIGDARTHALFAKGRPRIKVIQHSLDNKLIAP